jgi:hypothetical protein
MQSYFITPGFLSYTGVMIVACLFIAFYLGPRYGKKSMLVYLSICSLIGGPNVVSLQGVGSAVLAQIRGKAQFNGWFIYVLIVFLISTLLVEIIYLNVSFAFSNDAGRISSQHHWTSFRFPANPTADNRTESTESIQCGNGHANLFRLFYVKRHYRIHNPLPRS